VTFALSLLHLDHGVFILFKVSKTVLRLRLGFPPSNQEFYFADIKLDSSGVRITHLSSWRYISQHLGRKGPSLPDDRLSCSLENLRFSFEESPPELSTTRFLVLGPSIRRIYISPSSEPSCKANGSRGSPFILGHPENRVGFNHLRI